jgi:hypothetical protein
VQAFWNATSIRIPRRRGHSPKALPTPLKSLVKGALRACLRQAHEGPVDLEAVSSALHVPSLIENRPQYLPKYALA